MSIEIRECILTRGAGGGDVVQLHISDAPLGDSSASLALHLTITVPRLEAPLVLHLEREAMRIAHETLGRLLQESAHEITASGHGLEPRVSHRR